MVAEVKTLQSQNSEIDRMEQLFRAQREAFARHPYPTAEERLDQIARIKKMLLEHIDQICEAVNQDFGNRSVDETKIMEIITSLEGVKYNSRKLDRKSTRLNSSHVKSSYAVFCLQK